MKTKNVLIVGNIGVGKTTIIDALVNERTDLFTPIYEPVKQWQDSGFLQLFYEDKKKYAFPFQQYVYVTRLAEYHRVAKSNRRPYLLFDSHFLVDSNIFMKSLYDQNEITEQEFKMYQQFAKTSDHLAPQAKPDILIYLKSTPELCLSRISERSRTEETAIDISYLAQIHANYEILFRKQQCSKIAIDATQDVNSIMSDIFLFLQEP